MTLDIVVAAADCVTYYVNDCPTSFKSLVLFDSCIIISFIIEGIKNLLKYYY